MQRIFASTVEALNTIHPIEKKRRKMPESPTTLTFFLAS